MKYTQFYSNFKAVLTLNARTFILQVSPVLSGKLDVPKEKDATSEPAQEAPKQPQEQQQNPPSTVTETTNPTASEQPVQPQQPIEEKTEPVEPTRKNSVALEPKPSNEQEKPQEGEHGEAPMCGPEMINTLEQLKISLDNLKHGGHPTAHKKESSDDVKKISSCEVPTSLGSGQPQPAGKPTVAPQTSTPQIVTIQAPTFQAQNSFSQSNLISGQGVISQASCPSVVSQAANGVPTMACSTSQPVITQVAGYASLPQMAPLPVATSFPVQIQQIPVIPIQVRLKLFGSLINLGIYACATFLSSELILL